MRDALLIWIGSIALASGCRDSRPAAAPPPRAPATAALVATPERQTLPSTHRAAGLPWDIAARLARERQSRGQAGQGLDASPTAERLAVAVGAVGIELVGLKQYLAAPVHANFCMGGRTGMGLRIAVCEYPDGRSARRGRDISLTRYRTAGWHRAIFVNRSSTLTLSGPGDEVLSTAQARTVADAFGAL